MGKPLQNGEAYLYEQVAEKITKLFEQGTLRPGERIPSVRRLSSQLAVSISTVLKAYFVLENRGLVEARPQSGFYVRSRLRELSPEPETSNPSPSATQVGVGELVSKVFQWAALGVAYDFPPGHPLPSRGGKARGYHRY